MTASRLIQAALDGMPTDPIGAHRSELFVAALAGRCAGSGDPCLQSLAEVLRGLYRADIADEAAADQEQEAAA